MEVGIIKTILAIDPAPENSAYCFIRVENNDMFFLEKEKTNNETILNLVKSEDYDTLVIEGMQNLGRVVGDSVFETCYWIGRFMEGSRYNARNIDWHIIKRSEEKKNLCHTVKCKDKDIRKALIDRFSLHDKENGKGTKNNKDIFYGVAADVWSAIAIGVTYVDTVMHKK